MEAYNLLDEAWIPVLFADGESRRLGIRDTLGRAGEIRQIAASNPMDRVALLRFLLAILYWCRGNPQGPGEKDKILASGRFPADFFRKLEEGRDCFNLLGNGDRLYQNAAYKDRAPEHTADYLIHEVPSGTNKWHFRHATDLVDGLCPACCAMGLIRLPVFATSAGRGMSASTGKSPGINSKPPLYVLPVGPSLIATLLLLWLGWESELGTPDWEQPGRTALGTGEVPLLRGLTWVPRSIWLGEPEEPESTCASCGRKELLIRRCVFDGKGSIKGEGRVWHDPHLVYVAAKEKTTALQTSNVLGSTDAAAGEWARQLAAILREGRKAEGGASLIVGFSTVQNDKYLEATDRLLRLGIPPQTEESIRMLDLWQEEGGLLRRRMQPKNQQKSSARRHTEIRPAVDAVRPQVEARVWAYVARSLSGDHQTWALAAREYSPMIGAVAASLSPGFTTRAVTRRGEIARTLPRMTEEPSTKGRTRRKADGSRP
jgi:hypothetical protein